jgi:hypothetical protein
VQRFWVMEATVAAAARQNDNSPKWLLAWLRRLEHSPRRFHSEPFMRPLVANGLMDKAIADYRKVLEVHPDDDWAKEQIQTLSKPK